VLLQSESLISKCTRLHTVAASNNRYHTSRSLYYCLFVPHIYGLVLFFVHILFMVNYSFNATPAEGCNNIRSFLQQTALIARSLCEGCNWHGFHILVTAPFFYNQKAREPVHKTSHCGSKQQSRSHITITLLTLVRAKYGCYSLRLSRSWWIAHSMKANQEVATVPCTEQDSRTNDVQCHVQLIPYKKFTDTVDSLLISHVESSYLNRDTVRPCLSRLLRFVK